MRPTLSLIVSAVLMSTAAFPSGRDMQTCTVSPSIWTSLSGDAFVMPDVTLSPTMQEVFEIGHKADPETANPPTPGEQHA